MKGEQSYSVLYFQHQHSQSHTQMGGATIPAALYMSLLWGWEEGGIEYTSHKAVAKSITFSGFETDNWLLLYVCPFAPPPKKNQTYLKNRTSSIKIIRIALQTMNSHNHNSKENSKT